MEPDRIPIAFTVNRRSVDLRVEPHHTLLAVLRDQVQLTGTKECCSEGECGACTVLVDGVAVNACLVLAVEADGCAVTTIEGLADGDVSRRCRTRSSITAPCNAASAFRA